jgi:hypothetical protein
MKLVVLLLLLFFVHASTAAEPLCATDATERAKKLLTFHVGEGFEDQMGFESPSQKSPIKNPANPKQTLKVLEVEAYVRPHGRYRMRFIYFTLPRGCLLMGEEILELANL